MLNAIWRHMQTINTCAAVVWASDATRRGRYSMYPKGSFSAKNVSEEK